MPLFAATLAAATLLPGDLPEAEKQRRLAPYFSPRPGESFELDPTEVRDHERKSKLLRLRGTILVSPPKGSCFTVQKSDEAEDVEVCAPRSIPFTLEDAGRDGKIRWLVKTGDGDFGTPLSWSSPYRVAMVVPFDALPDDPMEYRFVTGCTADRSAPGGGRRLSVRFLGGESWIVRFPETDQLLPQPESEPNLFIHSMTGKISVTQAAAKSGGHAASSGSGTGGGHDAHGSGSESAGGSGSGSADGHGSEAGTGSGSAPALPAKKVVVNQEILADPNSITNDRTAWSIPLRGAYVMQASYFQPRGSVPPGMKGFCRYLYDVGPEDPGVGRLECHDGDFYKFALVPLACLKALKL